MKLIDALLTAKTSLEFFTHLARLTMHSPHAGFQARLSSVATVDGQDALQLTLRQPTARQHDNRIRFEWITSHVFTLYATGLLRWQPTNESEIVGLDAVQARLRIRHGFTVADSQLEIR